MIVADDSPLRQLPSALNQKQTFFFNAIRYTIEMADLAYARLCETLADITMRRRFEVAENVSAVLDAWSIIDSVFRLRVLLRRVPGLKQKRSSGLQVFLRKTSKVENLRHLVQHLDKGIEDMVQKDLPVLGELSWFFKPNPEDEYGTVGFLWPGTLFKSKGNPLVNPAGQEISLPVGLVTLMTGEGSLCLSEVMTQVEQLARGIERGLEESFGGYPSADYPRAPSDMVFFVDMKFGQSDGTSS